MSAHTLGRHPSCDIVLQDDSVSGRHARVETVVGGHFTIADLGSRNGTFVLAPGGWERVGSMPRYLGPSDVVSIGDRRVDVAWLRDQIALRRVTRAADNFALFNPLQGSVRQSGVGMGVAGAMAALGTLMALGSIAMLGMNIGLGSSMVGLFAALAPAPFYFLLWLWLDRYDPEPVWALIAAVAWGGGVAIFVSGGINTVVSVIGQNLGGPGGGQIAGAVLSAPFVEEGTKALGVLLLFLFLRREFDGVVDGLVFGGLVALGFATIENVQYYAMSSMQGDLPRTLVLRGVMSPFAHAVFTASTGIGFGLSRESHSTAARWLFPIAGYGGAVMLHMIWNGIAVLFGGEAFLVAYFIFWMPLFVAFIVALVMLLRREHRILRRMLESEVSLGLLTHEQLGIVTSQIRRIQWLASAMGDFKRFRARAQFLRAASKLGLSSWHVERAQKAGGMTISLPQVMEFRRDVERLRSAV
jgi:RsiW-degrading membrane proteinase PrsW (M82 family)